MSLSVNGCFRRCPVTFIYLFIPVECFAMLTHGYVIGCWLFLYSLVNVMDLYIFIDLTAIHPEILSNSLSLIDVFSVDFLPVVFRVQWYGW